MSDQPLAARNPHSVQAWTMVLIGTFAVTAGSAIFATFGLIIQPVAQEYGVGIDYLAGAVSLAMFISALIAPIIGKKLDTGSIRVIMSTGTATMGLGLLLLAQLTSPLLFFMVFSVVVGLAIAMLTPMVPAKLITNWFVKNRGLPLAILALPIGPTIFPLIANYLIEAFGWRGFYRILGVVCLVAFALAQLVKNKPEDSENIQDEQATSTAHSDIEETLGYVDLLRNPRFWIIVVFSGILMAGMAVLFTHMIVETSNQGLSGTQGAFLLALLSAAGVPGSIAMGWAVDRKYAYAAIVAVGMVFAAVTLILFYSSVTYSNWLILISVLGFAAGGLFVIMSTMLTHLVGAKFFGTAIGLATTIVLFIGAAMPYIAGVIYTQMGNYSAYFIGQLAIVTALSVGLWLFVRPKAADAATLPQQ